jgi:hypothetical protein
MVSRFPRTNAATFKRSWMPPIKKMAIKGKAARLSDSLDRIQGALPEATLVKICDRIDNLSRLRGPERRIHETVPCVDR